MKCKMNSEEFNEIYFKSTEFNSSEMYSIS